jgi:hypothetical protein
VVPAKQNHFENGTSAVHCVALPTARSLLCGNFASDLDIVLPCFETGIGKKM